jgi:glycosyltransferase involved in cell wall biosynthesis
MHQVTVAIPVYNGEAYLERCLRSVQSQTETNFVALIYDNTSTDNTQKISESFCEHDPRFSYFRQPFNKGAANNFLDALAVTKTEFFFWVAHDDFLSPNYIEELLNVFRAKPHVNLAVPHVHSVREDGTTYGSYPLPDMESGNRIEKIGRLLREAPPSWFYAIWRTNTLRDSFNRVWGHYPFGWASDHLTLYTQHIRDTVAGTDKACFNQTIQHRPIRIRPPVKHMRDLRRRFKAFCLAEAEEQNFTSAEMARLRVLIDDYTDHRCYSRRKIFRRALREFGFTLIGKKPN